MSKSKSIRFPNHLHDYYSRLAKQEDRSFSKAVVRACQEQYDPEAHARLKLIQDGARSN